MRRKAPRKRQRKQPWKIGTWLLLVAGTVASWGYQCLCTIFRSNQNEQERTMKRQRHAVHLPVSVRVCVYVCMHSLFAFYISSCRSHRLSIDCAISCVCALWICLVCVFVRLFVRLVSHFISLTPFRYQNGESSILVGCIVPLIVFLRLQAPIAMSFFSYSLLFSS